MQLENLDLGLDQVSEGKWWGENVRMGGKAQKCGFCRCLLCSKMIEQMKLWHIPAFEVEAVQVSPILYLRIRRR